MIQLLKPLLKLNLLPMQKIKKKIRNRKAKELLKTKKNKKTLLKNQLLKVKKVVNNPTSKVKNP
jgi:hypothetical protein